MLSVTIPQPEPSGRRDGIYDNTTRGIRIYLATPRLRGLLALNLSVAAAGAMVIVNTVVLVKGLLGGTDSDVALALACFGGGSMTAALLLPRLLDRMADRAVMLPSAGMLGTVLVGLRRRDVRDPRCYRGLAGLAIRPGRYSGIAYSAVMTPSGRLLRRSASAADRPAVYNRFQSAIWPSCVSVARSYISIAPFSLAAPCSYRSLPVRDLFPFGFRPQLFEFFPLLLTPPCDKRFRG